MEADQLHPPPGDGPEATADERRNVAGLDNVMNALQSSPLVKKLPARKNELLHAFFRDDSLARMEGEPIAMWLVRYNEQLGKLNRVGLDIVLVSRKTELNVLCLGFLMTRSHWMRFLLNSIRVFASVHMSEHVSSTPAIPPGRAWSSNERERVPRNPRPHHRWGQSRPTFAAERTQNQSASSAQWDTFEEVVDTEDEDNDGSDTIDPGDLQELVRDELEVLATCMDNGENDAPIPGVDNSQLETACLKLAELPEDLAIVQAAQRGEEPQTQIDTLVLLQAARANLDNHSADNVYPTVHVISDRAMTDQLRSSEELKDLATASTTKRHGFASKVGQTKSTQRLSCVSPGDPQCPGRPVNVIELEDEVQEFEPNQDAGTR